MSEAFTKPWMHAFARVQRFKDALASVALSHPASCSCDTCKAAGGDEDAFARLLAESEERHK